MSLRLLVASQDGYLYVYQIAPVEGGDCRLIVKHDLRDFEHTKDKAAVVQVQGMYMFTNIHAIYHCVNFFFKYTNLCWGGKLLLFLFL